MSIFELDTEGQRQLAEEAAANPATEPKPVFFTGLAGAIGSGIMRGGARTGEVLGVAATAPVVLYDKLFGTEHADSMFRAIDENLHSAVDWWTPGPNEVGTAGRILGGFAELPLPLMLGGGNPTFLIANSELGTAKDLVSQGVSPGTAIGAGTVEGAATAVGFKLPFLGNTLASRVTTGALGNLGVNTVASAINEQILKRGGYAEQAVPYDPANMEARVVDLLSGAAFGGLAHLSLRVPPSVRDAALAAENAKHFQEGTAPGVPNDIASSVIHQNALAQAIHDTLRGEKVEAPPNVLQAEFTRVPRAEVLPQVERIIESALADKVETNTDAAIAEYEKLPDSNGGKILNTDLARELSPEYRADRTLSAAVHEPASFLVKEMYARKLAEAPAEGELPLVMFTAGGTGAGKTTAIAQVPELAQVASRAQIIYDTNLNNFKSAVQKIDQALAVGKDVRIAYVTRNPVEALTQGALPRAMRMGRTVPLTEHAKTHAGGSEVIQELARHYAGNDRVRIRIIDNTRGKGGATLGSLDQVKPLEYNAVLGDLNAALEAERKAGRISEAVYRGTLQQRLQDEGGSGHLRSGTDAGAGGQPQPAGARGESVSSLASAARQLVAKRDLQIPTGELDAEGNTKTVSAADLLDQARADVVQAEKDSRAFEAAVQCLIMRGA